MVPRREVRIWPVIASVWLASCLPAKVALAQVVKVAERPWIVLAEGESTAVLELAACSTDEDYLKLVPLQAVGNRLLPRDGRMVAKFRRCTGAYQTICACRLTNGAWAVAQSELPGGARVLQYLLIGQDLSTLEGPVQRLPEVISSVRLVDQNPDVRPAVVDLGNPRIVEHAGGVYLVGDSRIYSGQTDARVAITWIAAAKPAHQHHCPGRVLNNGRIIGKGENPRVARLGNEFVVALQERQPNVDVQWGKWVRLYRSADLENWERFPGPPDTLEFYDYELTVARGKLTLVGVVDTSRREERRADLGVKDYTPPLALVTLVYDAEQSTWREQARHPDAGLTRGSELHLVPPEATGGKLKLIDRQADGQFVLRTLSE